jgi:hypothetical protein
VVDFVLKYAGIPAGCLDHFRLSAVVKAANPYLFCARHKSRESGQAKTAFEEGFSRLSKQFNLRVDDHVKRDFPALTLLQLSL